MRNLLACLALCTLLAACGSSTEGTGSPPAPSPASPLVRVERALQSEFGARTPECSRLSHRSARPRFRCFFESSGIMTRVIVTERPGGRHPVVSGCRAVQQKKDEFVTCSVKRRAQKRR